MELARTLKILRRRRGLVALGLLVAALAALLSVYRVSLFPPGLEARTNVFAAATTQILVDTPDSAFADLGDDLTPLNARAGVFARFLTSPTAIEAVAREAKLPAGAIAAQGPYDLNVPEFQRVPTAEKRSTQIIGEGALYRLRFESNPELPIISVFAQAPTRPEALALASAVPAALEAYVRQIQVRQQTPPSRQVEIRELGRATGGIVNQGANVQIAALVFIAVFIGWCMLLVPAHTIARGWREAGAASEGGYRPGSGDGNGAGGHGEALTRAQLEHEHVR